MTKRKTPDALKGHAHVSALKAPYGASTRSKRQRAEEATRGDIASERRHAMISDAAYFLSEQRGFGPGRELDDWLSAEKAIDRELLASK